MTLAVYAITRPGKAAVFFREKANAERWIANAGDQSAAIVELVPASDRTVQAEPVAHLVAMSNGDDDAWFEVADGDGKYDFPVYDAPRLPRDVLMAVARDREARAQAEREAQQRRQALAPASQDQARRLRHRLGLHGLAGMMIVAEIAGAKIR